MYGPPGCGKTLLARATAGECGAKFYNIAITDVLDMYIGESERKLHEIFELARRTAPACGLSSTKSRPSEASDSTRAKPLRAKLVKTSSSPRLDGLSAQE